MVHPCLEGVEGAPGVQVWGVHDVPGRPQLVGERDNPRSQPLGMVEQQNFSHLPEP